MEVMQLLLLLLFRRRGSSLAWRRTKWEGRASHGGGGDVQEKKRHSRTQTGRDLAKCVRTKNRMGPGGGRRRGEGDRTAYGQGRRAAGVVFLSRFVDRPLPAAAEAVRPTDRRRAIFLQATSLGSFSFFANERAPLFSLSVRRTRNALFPPVRPLLRRRKRGAERTAGANLQKFCTLGLARAPPLAPPPPPPPPFAPPSRRPPAALQSPLANFLCLAAAFGGGGKRRRRRTLVALAVCKNGRREGGMCKNKVHRSLFGRRRGLVANPASSPPSLLGWDRMSYGKRVIGGRGFGRNAPALTRSLLGGRFLERDSFSCLFFSKWAAIY